MNRRQHNHFRTQVAVALAAGLAAGLLGATPGAVLAQPQPARLVVRSCSAASYPQITCAITPVEATGLPITGVLADAFTVSDGSTALAGTSVTEGPGEDTSTSTLLVLDMASGNPAHVTRMRAAIEASLQDKPLNELVGLIALTGKLENPSSADTVPLDDARESAFSKDSNKDVINKVRNLNVAASTIQLHDALYKSLLMTRRQPFGTRAVVVMTDGFDAKRTTESNLDSVINYARQEAIPVYVFGVDVRAGADKDRLKRLAVSTNGAFTPVPDPAAAAKAYRDIQSRLKAQYAIGFSIPNPDKTERQLTFQVTLPDQRTALANFVIKPEAPALPQIEAVKFLAGGAAADVGSLPLTEIVIEPTIYAQTTSRVEYQVDNGDTIVKIQSPFTYTLRAGAFEPGSVHSLLVKAYGAEGKADQVAEQKIEFTLGGAPPAPVVDPNATTQPVGGPVSDPNSQTEPLPVFDTFLQNPVLSAALVVGVLALVALLVLIISSLRRRSRRNDAPPTDVITSPAYDGTGNFSNPVNSSYSGFTNGLNTVPAGGLSGLDDRTQVFNDLSESPKTQVLQMAKAMLEVMTGPAKGERLPLGVPGKTRVEVGRDADPLVGDLQLKSTFISRQHAAVLIEDDDLYVIDLNSSSGTKVNGEKLKPNEKHKIEIGTEISFADVRVKVNSPD